MTGGVIRQDIADKMAEKMAAPTRATKEDRLNVCSTPSTPQDSSASSQGPSTHSPADTMTDHSLEGEWKEVVSKKKAKKANKKLSVCTQTPPRAEEKDTSMAQKRKSPSPSSKEMRVRSPLQDPGREKLIAGHGREYPLQETYDLDEVVTDQQPDKTKYIIIRAYRQPRQEEKFNVDLPSYFIRFLGTSTWYLAKGPTSKYYHENNYNDIEERFKRAVLVDNAILWYDDLDHCCQGPDLAAANILKKTSTCPSC